MARVVVIRIVVDNRDAINAVKVQREEQKKLNEQIAATAKEARNAEAHAARMTKATHELSHVQQGLTNSFIKGNLAARAISATYLTVRDSVRFAVGESAKFELTMARVAAVTGSSASQIQNLERSVYGLARSSSASTSEIAATSLELAKLGFSGQNLEIVLGGVSKLSATLGDSLEATGQLVGGVVNTFNLGAEEAAKVADKLFVATGRSATNIEGFKVAFSLAGNVAADAGISFEEFATAVAVLSNQGIRASTIGTGLRNLIAELGKEGSKARKAIGGDVNELGLTEVISRLSEFGGNFAEVFGKPGAPVASGLAKAGDAFEKMGKQVQNASTELEVAGELINETLIGSTQRLTNNLLEMAQIFGGRALLNGVRDFFGSMSDGLKGVLEAQEALSINDEFFKESKKKGVSPFQRLGIDPELFNKRKISPTELANLIREYQAEQEKTDIAAAAFNDLDLARQEQRDLVKSGKTQRSTPVRTAEDMLADFEKITLAFERFQAFGGEFSFDDTAASLEKLATSLDKIGETKDAIRVLNELQTIRAYQIKLEKEEAESFQQSRRIEEGLIGTDIFDMSRRGEEDKGLGDRLTKGKKKLEDDRQKAADKAAKELFEKDKVRVFFKEVEDSLDIMSVKVEALTISFNALGDSTQLFGEYLVDAFLGHGKAFSDFQDAFGNLAKQFVADLIAMQLRILAFKAAIAIFSLFGAASAVGLAGGAGGVGAAPGATDLLSIPATAAASGFDGYVSSPRLFLAGEGGETERVKITPMSKMSADSGGGMTTIIVQGDVFDSEKLVDKIALTNERTRTRYV